MEAVLIAAVIAVVLFFVLALFAKGGAGETVHLRKNQVPLGAGPLPKRVQDALFELGYRIEHVETTVNGETDLVATDTRPVTGQRIYVRAYPDEVTVTAVEAQAALDRLKEGFHKAVLIARGGFSDEARNIAADSQVELLDAEGFARFVSAPARLVGGQVLRPQEA